VNAQRLILTAAVATAVGLVWLRGGFVGLLPSSHAPAVQAPVAEGLASATFASGCFWSTEAAFDEVAGVVSTTSGYTGGREPNPTYDQVAQGRTGHAEAVRVVFDPSKVSYDALLEQYWRTVDPFTADRQFCDVGRQYRPAIFAHDEAQRTAADASKAAIERRLHRPVVVDVSGAGAFYPAEAYHQDYHTRNAAQYAFYRYGCGRDRRLAAIWGDTE